MKKGIWWAIITGIVVVTLIFVIYYWQKCYRKEQIRLGCWESSSLTDVAGTSIWNSPSLGESNGNRAIRHDDSAYKQCLKEFGM